MKRILVFFICLRSILFASFFEEEDPMHYYHVNIISGHLDLTFLDVELKSPIPFSLRRNYTSAGALERSPDNIDLRLKSLRGWGRIFQGGWSLLSHSSLLVKSGFDQKHHQAYLCEKNSSQLIPYSYYKRKKKYSYLKPETKNTQTSGNLSARKKIKHNILKISDKEAILFLPDGSERHYSGRHSNEREGSESHWKLDVEILPSKHRVAYHYSGDGSFESENLVQVQLQNPQGTTTFASIDFDKKESVLHAKTSDGKCITYQMGTEFKERTYLQQVETSIRSKDTVHYQPGRRGIGARIGGLSFGPKEQFRVEYYHPTTKAKERKRAKKPKKHLKCDKVRCMKFPDPERGEFVDVAEFSYFPEYTEVKDCEGIVTRYFHDQERLLSIEYFDREGRLHSKVEFEWKNDNLRAKRQLDGKGNLLFSKSFVYDDAGNVLREDWRDHQTQAPPIRREFNYSKKRLVLSEEEMGGLAYRYGYLPRTDLLTKKFTLYKRKVLLREFLFYNEDNLLICKIVDDGTRSDPDILTNVTERKIERFDLDPETGLCQTLTEYYLDLKTLTEKEFRKHQYTYNEKREVASETIIYGPNEERYTIYKEYDDFGNIIKQTTPLGRENTFTYDELGNLIETKEVGHPKKTFIYDHANRPIQCTEAGKITQSTYDIKGRLLQQTDTCGNVIHQTYDGFGRCIETRFPETINARGDTYIPKITSSYDIQGNLISNTNPRGETIVKEYNILRKPTLEENQDGSLIRHQYNRDGTISKTIYPDQTEILFTYDSFQRMTSKTILSADGEVLSEEKWTYNTFHLLSYTNPLGLTTHYQYDALGRKIAETAEDRTITYSYDALGFLEKVTQDGYAKVQIHNIEGEIIEEWEEDELGKIENHMFFFYDNEGRKEKAIRITSKQEAGDHFFYDEEGHFCKHIDPLGESSHFIYSQVLNSLGQTVEQKIAIDPLGNTQIETHDANSRIASIEKKDQENQTVSREQYFYDEAGNNAKRQVTIFQKKTPLRQHTTLWEYNERGWPIKEIEEDEKCTIFEYDTRGRIVEKTFPSGVILFHTYDAIDRLIELKSSDGTIHYEYTYGKGNLPIQAEDKILHLTWERTYNTFGEITSETRPDGSTYRWSNDNRGRCESFTLPDSSSLTYSYTPLHLESIARYSSDGQLQYTHHYTQFDENGHVSEEELINNLGPITTTHDLLERTESQKTPWNTSSIAYGPSGLVQKTENSLFESKEYQYDSLNQLEQEGEQKYHFDSLGNPLEAQVNQFNQIISTSCCKLFYNENGNPFRQNFSDQVITYDYDALNRLISIHSPDQKHIHYTYDPFSRLYSKETYSNQTSFFSETDSWSREITYYLYDQEKEIGTLDDKNALRELKVLGLGILGDIGATVAIELGSEVFAPLHDFSGNIIALINSKGTLTEKTDIDAFGKAILSTPYRNPWRFHSKRKEEHLVFFGSRFYDPNLGRWLTPDPAGSLESPNLYLYVRNSPLNRLDLFGLYSEDFDEERVCTEVLITSLMDESSPYVHCRAFCGEIQTDWIIVSNQFHKLQYTPEELQTGTMDILNHFQELFSNEGMGIGLTTFQNGIKNTFQDFEQSSQSIADKIPGDGLMICMYVPTNGIVKDVSATFAEKKRKETPEVIMTRQAMIALTETLGKVNPNLLWLHINHSRAGAIGCAAIDGMERRLKPARSSR